MRKRVCVFLAEGFEEIEAIAVIDILNRAGVDVCAVSISGNNEVKGAHDITIKTDDVLANIKVDLFDVFFLPGGMPGAKNLDESEDLKHLLKEAYSEGKIMAAICAAPLVYGKMGILEGQKATCYPGFEKDLLGAEIIDVPVVESGQFVTRAGPGAVFHFSYMLVEKLVGIEKANELKKGMLVQKFCGIA